MPQIQKNPYSEVTADEINKTYTDGYITAQRKNELIRKKAEAEVQQVLGTDGYLGAVWKQTIKNYTENWETLKEIASTPEKDITVYNDVKNGIRSAWAMAQLALAPLNAIGAVNGAEVERAALWAGAPPGAAKVLGIAADVGTGFLPVAGATRQAVKGVQQVGKTVKGLGQGGKLIDAAAQTAGAEAKAAEAFVEKTIKGGLAADGVQVGAEAVTQAGKVLTPQEEFVKALREYRKELSGITETKAHAVTLAEAAKLNLGIDDLRQLVPGTALKEAEMAAYLKALDVPVDALIEAAKGVTKGTVEGSALGKMFNDFFQYSPKFRAAEVTAGRSVEILKETPPMKGLTDMMVGWDSEAMAKMNPEAVWKTIAEDILAMADEPGKLKALQVTGASEVAKNGFQRWWSYGREAYINLLLARPVTQVRNFLGNSFAAVNSGVERELAGWLSIDQAKGIVRGEGMAQFQGMMASMADHFSALGKGIMEVSGKAVKGDIKGAAAQLNEALKVAPSDLSKLDYVPHQIPGLIGRLINVPGDAMRGMDNFFKAVLTKGDYYATAIEHGTHMGLTGDALADYVARRIVMPTEAMRTHGAAFALEQTFQNDLGTMGKAAQKLGQAGPMVYLFPFMKTPMNLAKYAWNRTPGLNLLSKSLYEDILAGGTRADMAIARLTLSNMMGTFWYGLAQQGLLTGGGPADPTLKRSWQATKQPYSILGADGWYPITNIEPATTPLGLIADFAEIHNQLDEPTAQQMAMMIALAGVRDIVDKSYWQTVGQAVDLVGAIRTGEEPSKNALRIAQGPLVTAMSGGPLGAGVTRAIDPISRESRGLLDQVRARIPGYSSTMPPMRDGYGDPIIPPQPLGSAWLGLAMPFTHRPEEPDAIKKEGARLQARLPQFPWSTGGGQMRDDFDVRAPLPGEAIPVELTPQQRDRWQVIYRTMLRDENYGLPAVMASDQYKNGTWAYQRNAFMNTLALARDGAKAALLTEDVELGKKVVESSGGKYLPMIPAEQRAGVQDQISGQLDLLDELAPKERENLMKFGILDDGKQRDEQVLRLNVEKSIPELNKAAQGASHPVQMEPPPTQ